MMLLIKLIGKNKLNLTAYYFKKKRQKTKKAQRAQ